MLEIFNNIIVLIGAISGTGIFTFWFTKSKYKVDVLQVKENVESTAIDNDVKLSAHYKDILEDLKNRYETRYQEYDDMMKRKIALLEEELKLQNRKIKLQQQEILELKRENKTLRLNAKTSTT